MAWRFIQEATNPMQAFFHKKFEMEQFAGNAVKGFFDKMCEEVEADAFA